MSSVRKPLLKPGSGRRVAVIAHRGNSSEAPENTLAAFRKAVVAGADGVELDARASADGTLHCLHDDTLDRTTNALRLFGQSRVHMADVDDARIALLDAGAWCGRDFARERVPTLAEALAVICPGALPVIERKDGDAERYVGVLREQGLVGRAVVMAFEWGFLSRLHGIEPDQPLAVLGEGEWDAQQEASLPATGACVVAWRQTDVTAERVSRWHELGLGVWCWTADTPVEWARLVAAGADGIITNRPAGLIQWIRERDLSGCD